jgi:hypothetical protein
MNTNQNENSSVWPSPEKLEAALRKIAPELERLEYLRQRHQDGTATSEEEDEYDDMTWWMHGPMPALPPPEGTPNPWELPRPPKKRNGNGEA